MPHYAERVLPQITLKLKLKGCEAGKIVSSGNSFYLIKEHIQRFCCQQVEHRQERWI